MWKVEALFQGHSPTWCLLLCSYVSCEEDERNEGNVSVEQRIIIKFLTKEGCKPSEICSRLKWQYGEKTLSNVSVYKWSSAFEKGRETVENEPHERRPRTSITGENSDCVDALIPENRRITVRELSGILISGGSVKTISKDSHQEQEKKSANISVISPG